LQTAGGREDPMLGLELFRAKFAFVRRIMEIDAWRRKGDPEVAAAAKPTETKD
jgi:hypothetical protein